MKRYFLHNSVFFLRLFGFLIFSLLLINSFVNISYANTLDNKEQTIVSNTIIESSALIEQLLTKDLNEKLITIQNIVKTNTPQSQALLSGLLAGKIYAADNKILLNIDKDTQQYQILLVNKPQTIKVSNAQKVIIDNKIRLWLKTYQAEQNLTSNDSSLRKAAIDELLSDNNMAAYSIVQQRIVHESDKGIKKLMQVFLARYELQQGDENLQEIAIGTLGRYYAVGSVDLLNNYIAVTTNENLKKQALKSVQTLEDKAWWLHILQIFIFGLSAGSVLVLAAIGLVITFGVMGVINMAHGELIMLGAYCVYVIQQIVPSSWLTYSLLISIPVAFIFCGLVGVLIERTIIRFLYNRPLETLLATFGLSLILQQLVRTIFSPLNRVVTTPSWLDGSWTIFSGLNIAWIHLFIFGFSLLCFFVMMFILKKTRLGLEVNAVSQNRSMARSMGINDHRVDMLTFGLGSGIAGLAGVALSQIANVGPNLGQNYIIDSFMVVVVGGVGNLWGTLVSGLGLGIINSVVENWWGAVLAKAFILLLVILFIQKFPQGIFPNKGRNQQ